MESNIIKESLRDILKDYTQKEVAAALYDKYNDGRPWETWYAHVRKCFSEDNRERFEFCDIFFIMEIYGNLEPIFALCDHFGLSRPALLDPEIRIEAKIQEARKIRYQFRRVKIEIAAIESIAKGLDYVHKDRLEGKRF
jgi:hypothetical protein